MPTIEPLPPEVLDAVRRRDVIEAVKLLRKAKGIGLKEAKDRLDQYTRTAHPLHSAALSPGSVPAALADALQRGDKAEAIRLARAHVGPGLKEAMKAIEALRSKPGGASRGLSPGEVRGSGGTGAGWFVVLVAAGMAVFYFLRG